MKKFISTAVLGLVALSFLGLPFLALGQIAEATACTLRATFTIGTPPVTYTAGSTQTDATLCLYGLIIWITNWVKLFFGALVVLFIIWAAFEYMTAAGSEEKIKTAKKRLMYAVVAIIIFVFASAAPAVIKTTLGF